MTDAGFDANDSHLRRFDSLAAQLAKIEGRCLPAGEQYCRAFMNHDCTRPHFNVPPLRCREMALDVLELESPMASRPKLHVECHRTFVKRAADATYLQCLAMTDDGGRKSATALGSLMTTQPPSTRLRNRARSTPVPSPGAPPATLSEGSTRITGPGSPGESERSTSSADRSGG